MTKLLRRFFTSLDTNSTNVCSGVPFHEIIHCYQKQDRRYHIMSQRSAKNHPFSLVTSVYSDWKVHWMGHDGVIT